MSIPVVCSGCKARLNAPDAAAGKKLKCPKCQAVIAVPEPMAAADFEVVEDEPAPPAKKPAPVASARPKPTVPAAVVEDDDDEKPRKKKVAAVADDEDDRPKKKKKKKRSSDDDEEGGVSMARNIIGAVVLLILLAVVAFVFKDKILGTDDKASSNNTPTLSELKGRRG